MKNILLLAGCLLLVAACSDDDSDSMNSNATAVENTVKSGTWRITSYVDSGADETAHFTGYDFTFNSAGVLTASNGTNTYTGAWSVNNSDNSDDDSGHNSSDIDFNIAFGSPAGFADLTDDWGIAQRTGSKIVLEDISGGNGGTDILTFEKN